MLLRGAQLRPWHNSPRVLQAVPSHTESSLIAVLAFHVLQVDTMVTWSHHLFVVGLGLLGAFGKPLWVHLAAGE
jgi:hypothetical protein